MKYVVPCLSVKSNLDNIMSLNLIDSTETIIPFFLYPLHVHIDALDEHFYLKNYIIVRNVFVLNMLDGNSIWKMCSNTFIREKQSNIKIVINTRTWLAYCQSLLKMFAIVFE